MNDIVERLRAKELLSIEEDGYTHFLPKNPDGDDGADEIIRLRAENEKLRMALAPFAATAKHFKDDCKDTLVVKIGVDVGYLRAAAAAIRESE